MGLFSNALKNVNTTAVENKAEQPIVREVDVMSLMGALHTNGEAKLSDHIKEEPKVVETPAVPTHTSKTESKKREYVAPADAAEAKQRIEKAIAANTVTADENGDRVEFRGNTYGFRTELRMLGGEFDKEASLWCVPTDMWNDPSKAVATKSEKQQKHEERMAKQNAEVEKKASEQAAAIVTQQTGMITIEQAKANTRKALDVFLKSLASTKPETLDKIINSVYNA